MRLDRLPLTYDECRARFRRAAETAGARVEAHPISARGRHGQELTVDAVALGGAGAERALLVLSGVHGVEGYIGSALQTDLLHRLGPAALPDGTAVVLVHAVNPWGMSHDRRQNEHNVDLNRNWRRSDTDPDHNEAYDEMHPLACPDTPDLPSTDELVATVAEVVDARGGGWVRDAITGGQYRHADGLHYGGEQTEESCTILERIVPDVIGRAHRVLTVDLHTGEGRYGATTFLSSQPADTPDDRFLRETFGEVRPSPSTTPTKTGRIAEGIAQLLPDSRCISTTVEFGTAPDLEQLSATYQEQWVHRHGDLDVPAHRGARWRYRCCFTPDDPEWESQTLASGRDLLDRALAAVGGSTGSRAQSCWGDGTVGR